ncbi:MAG: hypothetical protein HND48_08615 [Chloroflexi bacterium]|nr:hypothetical protein [Chloroflexota bacterium]
MFGSLCGALPLAVWLGRAALRRDIREVGDRNPGALNVAPGWRAGVGRACDCAGGVQRRASGRCCRAGCGVIGVAACARGDCPGAWSCLFAVSRVSGR